MNVMINARHCEIADSLRERVESRLRELSRYNPKLAGAEVTFEINGSEHAVEARLGVHGTEPVIAHGAGADFRRAFDSAADRLVRQLKRKRERRVRHRKAAPVPPAPSPLEADPGA